jgi:hypothetical protein
VVERRLIKDLVVTTGEYTSAAEASTARWLTGRTSRWEGEPGKMAMLTGEIQQAMADDSEREGGREGR